MDINEIKELRGRELDARVAQVLEGWEWVKASTQGNERCAILVPSNWKRLQTVDTSTWQPVDDPTPKCYNWHCALAPSLPLPSYSTDLNTAVMLEATTVSWGWIWFVNTSTNIVTVKVHGSSLDLIAHVKAYTCEIASPVALRATARCWAFLLAADKAGLSEVMDMRRKARSGKREQT